MIFRLFKKIEVETGIEFAFQCCEHLNRALVIEAPSPRTADSTRSPWSQSEKRAVQWQPTRSKRLMTRGGGIPEGGRGDGYWPYADWDALKTCRCAGPGKAEKCRTCLCNPSQVRPKLIGGARAVYEREKGNLSCS